jgi:multiple sugar transport system permease protein
MATLRIHRYAHWLFLLPALLGFALFHAVPTVRALTISFTDWNLLSTPQWVGWANYRALWEDESFWRGLKLAGLYALLNIPLQTVLGLGLAVAMDRLTRALWVRTVVLMPYLLSNVLVALVWLWMLDPAMGIVNHLIEWLGASRQPFFASPDQALLTTALVNTWRHMGLVSLLFLAGLQTIPRDLYSAAAIDGAGEWQMFRRITLPLLRPVMVFVLVTSVTGSFQVFDTIAVTTNGGPVDATRVVVLVIVQNAFGYYRMGYASAMAMVLTALMLAYTLVQMRLMRAGHSDLG